MTGVTGCVAQAEGAEIVRRAPAVDIVVGPQSYHRLPELLAEAAPGYPVVETEFAVAEKFAALDSLSRHSGESRNPARTRQAPTRGEERASASDREARRRVSAFLTIQEGCDKFCTFCVVPYTRGAEVSRNAES